MIDKALFLSHEASRTGAPIILLNILGWLRRNESIPFRVVIGCAGELSGDFAALGVADSLESRSLAYRAMNRLHLQGPWWSSRVRRIRQDLAKERFGLVYVNSVASGGMLDLLSIGECPVICHVHELASAIRQIGLDHLEALERRQPLYIAASNTVKECLVREFGIAAARIAVVYEFVSDPRVGAPSREDARETVRRELGLPAAAKIVCGCGSIEARKGTDLFVDVARRVLAAGVEDLHFVWVGGAPDKTREMRALASSAGLASHLHFLGRREETGQYFAASDVFLLTSREDPFPLVVLEAARSGVPTVCFSDGGGAPEFVASDAGCCVPDFDVGAMSRRVIEVISSPALRAQMGEVARRRAEKGHTLERGATDIASRIREVMHRGRGATWTGNASVNSSAANTG